MRPLSELSYQDFGKLRFLDFFPKTESYVEDHEGGLETGIGLACSEGYPFTAFTSLPGSKWQTAEMQLDFDHECPEPAGHALLDQLGLKLRRGMSAAQVKQAVGAPEAHDPR